MPLLRNAAIITTPLPDGYVVLHSRETDWAQTLTPIAGIVWEFCDGHHTLEQIVDEVAALIEERPKDELKREITELMTELKKSGLVTEPTT